MTVVMILASFRVGDIVVCFRRSVVDRIHHTIPSEAHLRKVCQRKMTQKVHQMACLMKVPLQKVDHQMVCLTMKKVLQKMVLCRMMVVHLIAPLMRGYLCTHPPLHRKSVGTDPCRGPRTKRASHHIVLIHRCA